eukprot:6473684-Amphidinium_carterae.1
MQLGALVRQPWDLNFEIAKGDRILITGGNGGGKSSLFRVVRKLWPLVEGTITMPPDEDCIR